MALNLGELFGTIGLDDSEWQKKLKGAQGSLKTFGIAGAALAATAGAAIGVAITKGINDSMDIEAGVDKLQAQMALTEEQAGKAGAAAGSLYANNYGESMEQIREATGAVMSSMSGMKDASQEDLEDITMKALNLAAAFDTDVNESTATAGILMKTGLAKDADQAMDLITDAMQGVPASMRGEIFPIMDEYGKHFETLGIDGTTAFGIVKSAAQDGAIGMDKIGDALGEFSKLTVTADKGAAEAFELIGLKSDEMAEAMALGGEVGQEAFAKTIAGLQSIEDPAAQAQAAIALFGTPLEDLGTHNIPAFLGQMDPMGDAFDDVAGAAEQMNIDLNSNAKAGFDSFVRQADAALIKFVQDNIMPSVGKFSDFLNTEVGPAITKLGEWVETDALPALRNFQKWFTDNLPVITNWAQGIGFLLIPLFLRIAIAAGVSAAAQVVAWTLAGAGAIKTAAIYVAQSYIMIGRWVAMAAAATVSGATTAYIWLLYQLDALKAAGAFLLQVARIVAGWVAMAVASTVNAVKMAAGWVVGIVVPAAIGVASMAVSAASVVAGWALMAVQSTIQAVKMAAAWFIAMGPVGWVILAVIGLVALIIANWEQVSTFTKQAWDNIVQWIVQAWENVKTGVSNGISAVVRFVSELPGKILGFFSNAGSLLLSAGGNIIQGFLDGLTRGFESVKNFVGGIGQWIADNKGPKAYDLALLVPAGGWIMDGLEGGIEKSIPSLKKTLGGVSATIAAGVTGGTVGVSGSATAGSTGASNAYHAQAPATVSLHPEDRKLLRAVADAAQQPLKAVLNGREFLTATRNIRTT